MSICCASKRLATDESGSSKQSQAAARRSDWRNWCATKTILLRATHTCSALGQQRSCLVTGTGAKRVMNHLLLFEPSLGSIPQRFIRHPLSGNLFPIFSGVTAFVLSRTRQRFRISRHQLLCRRRLYMVRTLHRSVLNTGHHMRVGPAVLHPFRI